MIPRTARDDMQYPLVHTWAIITAHQLPGGPDLQANVAYSTLDPLSLLNTYIPVLQDLNAPWYLQD